MSSDGSPTETFTDLIAEISIDPRLIKLLGRSMYDSHPLVLVVRETLQNSRDACLRRGIEPEIHITVKLLPDQKAIVICRDNGIGMTAEELIKYFLRLGGTGKEDDPQSVGGLGLAKAVIMGGNDWSIHTRNYRTSMQDIIDRHPIRIVDFIDGTEVMTKIERKCYFSDLINAYLMAALSDVREIDDATRAHTGVVFAEGLGDDFPRREHALDKLAQPALLKKFNPIQEVRRGQGGLSQRD